MEYFKELKKKKTIEISGYEWAVFTWGNEFFFFVLEEVILYFFYKDNWSIWIQIDNNTDRMGGENND